jgi:amino acid transporter
MVVPACGRGDGVYQVFQSRLLSTVTGLLTVIIAVVSSAAVALGSAGYIQQFVDLPRSRIVVVLVVGLGAVAAWGILESVIIASVFTLIEAGGLTAIIVVAVHTEVPIVAALVNTPPFEIGALSGIAFGSLVVSFAWLAESTSLATLGVFALVSLALLRLRFRQVKSDAPHVTVPIWVPGVGLATWRRRDREFDVQVTSVVNPVLTQARREGFEIPTCAVIEVIDHAF